MFRAETLVIKSDAGDGGLGAGVVDYHCEIQRLTRLQVIIPAAAGEAPQLPGPGCSRWEYKIMDKLERNSVWSV